MQTKSFDSISAPAPNLSLARVKALVEMHWGPVQAMQTLTSERDQNIMITRADAPDMVLKIINAHEDRAVTDFQVKAMLHVEDKAPDLPIPHCVPMQDGALTREITLETGETCLMRAISRCPGTPLYHQPQISWALAADTGRLFARLNTALLDFRHPADAHMLLWDQSHILARQDLLETCKDPEKRHILQDFFARYQEEMAALSAPLRHHVIHNDGNLNNLLVAGAQPDRISGLIDFGDMVRAPLVNDIAIVLSYLMEAGQRDGNLLGACLTAYEEILPLEAEERAALPGLMAARHALIVLISEWRASLYPDNRDYILRNNRTAWSGLKAFLSRNRADNLAMLTHRM